MDTNRNKVWTSHDQAISKTILERGLWDGGSPQEGGVCEIIFSDTVGDLSQSHYLSTPCTKITIGEGDTVVDEQIDRAVRRMWVGELSRVSLLEKNLTFIVKLTNCSNPDKSYYKLDAESEAKLAEAHKEKGTLLFKSGRIEDALRRFSTAARYVIFSGAKENSELYCKICNNISLCKLKLGKPEQVLTLCIKVLDISPDNMKALVRRAEAYLAIQEPELARQDLNRVLHLFPSDTTAKRLFAAAVKDLAKQKEDSTILAKRMLSL